MNPAVTNIVVMLLMNQFAKKLNMEDETVIFYIRTAFISMNVLTYLIYQYTKTKIVAKNDVSVLKYTEKKSAFSMAADAQANAEDFKITTNRDYDLSQVEAAIKGMYSSIAMMAFMHLYMKYTQPLLLQSVSPVKSAFEAPVVQIHLFGKQAVGSLKRPFTAPSLFGGSAPAANDQEKIAKAEKSGNGGVKKD